MITSLLAAHAFKILGTVTVAIGVIVKGLL